MTIEDKAQLGGIDVYSTRFRDGEEVRLTGTSVLLSLGRQPLCVDLLECAFPGMVEEEVVLPV